MDRPRQRIRAGKGISTDPNDDSSGPGLVAIDHAGLAWCKIMSPLQYLFDLLTAVVTLIPGFILPEVRDWITLAGMGKKFNPASDIGSLEGKVIIVTGGMLTRMSLPFDIS